MSVTATSPQAAARPYLTQKQLAEHFQISLRMVENMIRDGRLRAVRVGKCVRIPQAEVERIAKQNV